MMSGAVEGVEVREAIIAAITSADAAFGYSYRMTGLVDGVETHTLFMDGFEPASFDDRSDGYPLIEQRRNAARTDAIIAARTTPPARSYADGIADAAKHLDERAERARVAAIGGGMDPLDAELLDYEYSNAAAAIRLLSQGEKA